MKRAARLTPVATLLVLTGCHLVDQRDFDARAGRKPQPPAAPIAASPGPRALLRITYDNPDPDYARPLEAAVQRALAVKPDVLFTVQTLVPPAIAPADQAQAQAAAAATGREVAEAIVADGADQGQIEMAVGSDTAVTTKEVRIFVH